MPLAAHPGLPGADSLRQRGGALATTGWRPAAPSPPALFPYVFPHEFYEPTISGRFFDIIKLMNGAQKVLVTKTADFVKDKMLGEGSGHDWWHIYRVWQTSKTILKQEPLANPLITELGALLHDIADWKFHNGDFEAGPRAARAWLASLEVEERVITAVEEIARNTSFKGAKVKVERPTVEAKIVSDADKLDAIGAIGIARAFAYGGNKNRPLYEPDISPVEHETFEAYKNGGSHTINHFYEKLLLLKDQLETESGRKLAEHRHVYMEQFLDEFYKEWEGEL